MQKEIAESAAEGLLMHFIAVEAGTPAEGELVLVRLKDNTFHFGIVLQGRFAAYERHTEQYVTMAHPDRITHFMVIHSPAAKAASETPEAELPVSGAEILRGLAVEMAEDLYL